MRPYSPSPIAARSWRLGTISAPSSSPTRRSTRQRSHSLRRAPRPVSPPTAFGPCSPAKLGSCSGRPVESVPHLDWSEIDGVQRTESMPTVRLLYLDGKNGKRTADEPNAHGASAYFFFVGLSSLYRSHSISPPI